jgi:hypothetical protein
MHGDEFKRQEIQLAIMVDIGCSGDRARVTETCSMYFRALFRHDMKLACGRNLYTLWTYWKN